MAEKRSWLVTGVQTRRVLITTDPCTREEAEADPLQFVTDELEIGGIDWQTESVEPNE